MKIALAGRNPHKLNEIRRILNYANVEWLDPDALADMPEVVEDGLTFASNAVKKAMTTAFYSKCWALADDSGLEVTALQGAPGVMSARYAGVPHDDAANNKVVVDRRRFDRCARFCCVVALADPKGRAQVVEGLCRPDCWSRGMQGFGYDPLFVPDGYERIFAEMDAALKTISHIAPVRWNGASTSYSWRSCRLANCTVRRGRPLLVS